MTEIHRTERADPPHTWDISADAPLQSVFEAPECPPWLRQTLSGPLSWQVRNETTVRRALISHRTALPWVAALLALGATVTLEGTEAPAPLADLVRRTSRRTVTGRVVTLHVPIEGIRYGAAQVGRTPADDPIVAAYAGVVLSDEAPATVRAARIALTGVWPYPVGLAQAATRLIGQPLDEERIQTVAQEVAQEVTPTGDFRGSEVYRREMAAVLTRRALEQCWYQE